MARYRVRVRGRGSVEVAAYGMADAEHLVEKEIGRVWPGARIEVTEVGRREGERIVEEFRVGFRVTGEVAVDAATRDEAPGAAFRHARGLLAATRYQRVEWESLDTREEG